MPARYFPYHSLGLEADIFRHMPGQMDLMRTCPSRHVSPARSLSTVQSPEALLAKRPLGPRTHTLSSMFPQQVSIDCTVDGHLLGKQSGEVRFFMSMQTLRRTSQPGREHPAGVHEHPGDVRVLAGMFVAGAHLTPRGLESLQGLRIGKRPRSRGRHLLWRRGGDSNPRDPERAKRFSRPPHSTALPPLHGRQCGAPYAERHG